MINYPRKVSSLGTERFASAVLIQSKLNTCGVLVMGRRGGPSPEGPSVNDPNEFYIYLDGTDPLTPRIGGVTEVTTNPAGGSALGAAVPKGLFDPTNARGVTVLGSDRVSSSVKVCGPSLSVADQNLPAFGIMYNAASAVMYFYILDSTRQLCYGNETAWAAGDATSKLGTPAPVGSGSLGNLRDGRTVFGNDNDSEALVIESGGKSGAIILASGDHQTGVALYIDGTGTPKFDNVGNWLTYALS